MKKNPYFLRQLKNHGTVTFSGVIKNVLVDDQNYSNFNGNTTKYFGRQT